MSEMHSRCPQQLLPAPTLNTTHFWHATAMMAVSLLVFWCSCGTSPTRAQRTALVQGHVGSTNNPQVAVYAIAPSSDATVTVQFGKDTNYGFQTSPLSTPPGGGPVQILVAGMQAKTTYHMRASVKYSDGSQSTDTDHTFTTGDVPANLIPSFTVSTAAGMVPQPGIEMVDDVYGSKPPGAFATDLAGNVIWTYAIPEGQTSSTLYPIKLLPNGHLVLLIAPQSQSVLQGAVSNSVPNVVREIDLAGNTIRELRMSDLNARLATAGINVTLQVFHHDVTPLPNGHWLVLANTFKQFDGLAGTQGTTNVLGDVVVDLDTNLQPVWVWNEFDHLDINRHPMSFPDWTHSNAINYSPDDGNILVSIRHQNWVVKVDYRDGNGSGAILWKLGPGGDFKLQNGTDPVDWFYAQHDPEYFSPNTTGVFEIGLMDNGNDRIFTNNAQCGASGAPACYSTVPVLQVDDHAMSATLKSHRVFTPDFFSLFAGSVDLLKNGHIEYNLAGVGADAYTFETTQDSTPQAVWQMHISGMNTYRVNRLPSLYPGVQW